MKLLRAFGSPAAIRTAGDAELVEAAGKAVAARLRAFLAGTPAASEASAAPETPAGGPAVP
jgi:hypothetical protein